jgi:aspartyl-tRNA(Asn)/glutamyl-tRNA(Gln) amidotransferase subunit B
MGELARALKDAALDIAESPVAPDRLAELLRLVERGTISGGIAKGVFEKMFASGERAAVIVEAQGLTQLDDESQIRPIIADVLAKHADAVAQYRAGKASTFGFLVGQVMRATGGKANPRRVNEMLRRSLDAS